MIGLVSLGFTMVTSIILATYHLSNRIGELDKRIAILENTLHNTTPHNKTKGSKNLRLLKKED